jgi:hypothetical protein
LNALRQGVLVRPLFPFDAQSFGVKDSHSMSEKNRIVFRAVPGIQSEV